ncbi:MAG: citrate transporter, partial [Nevskiales bacterium]
MQHPAIKFAGVGLMLGVVAAAALTGGSPPTLFGVRAEFLLFALTLAGVALLHHRTFEVAVTGLGFILLLKFLSVPAFHLGEHLQHEWLILTNLLGLLLGFAVLARHFEQSEAPELLPRYLPDGFM